MIRKGYIHCSFGQIHYRTAGNESMPQLLLLHQTASSSAMYERIINLVADEFYIFAPDTPGFGGSDNREEPATMEFYAAALREAAEKFGLRETFVFGHHTGASIAVEMEFQKRFARKMLLSGPPYLTVEQKTAFKAGVAPIVLTRDGEHIQKVWQRILDKDPSIGLDLAHREFVLNMTAGTRYHEAYRAVFDHEFETRLETLDCPILVVAGDNDTLNDSLEPAFEALRNGKMHRIAGNTFVCDQSPKMMADLMREFFV